MQLGSMFGKMDSTSSAGNTSVWDVLPYIVVGLPVALFVVLIMRRRMARSVIQQAGSLVALEPSSEADVYADYKSLMKLRDPHRIRPEFLEGILPPPANEFPQTPTVAFINPRSGGRAGPTLAVALRRALGVCQVYDLAVNRPDQVLTQLWQNLTHADGELASAAEHVQHSLRIIACGGDGTAAWILQCIERLNIEPAPPLAIIPLGTGNDLARSFGWGGAFDSTWTSGHKRMVANMSAVAEAEPVPLDRWKLDLTAPGDGYFHRSMPYAFVDQPCEDGKVSKTAFSWNYVSIGIDAKAAHAFHCLREESPDLAFSRTANQFWYGYFSATSGWLSGTAPPLNRKITLWLQDTHNADWREVTVPESVRAVVLLNLTSYGGGCNLWGEHDAEAEEEGFTPPAVDDGKIEVVAFGGALEAGAVMAGAARCMRLGQAAGVRVTITDDPSINADHGERSADRGTMHLQLDGEPWKQDVPLRTSNDTQPFEICMTHHGASKILLKPGFEHRGVNGFEAGAQATPSPRAKAQRARVFAKHYRNMAAGAAWASLRRRAGTLPRELDSSSLSTDSSSVVSASDMDTGDPVIDGADALGMPATVFVHKRNSLSKPGADMKVSARQE